MSRNSQKLTGNSPKFIGMVIIIQTTSPTSPKVPNLSKCPPNSPKCPTQMDRCPNGVVSYFSDSEPWTVDPFIDASKHLNKPLCLSVHPPIRPSAKTKDMKGKEVYSFSIAIVVIVVVFIVVIIVVIVINVVCKLSLKSNKRNKAISSCTYSMLLLFF